MLLALLGVFPVVSNSQQLTSDPTTGCSPLVVHFECPNPNALSYQWDFGNGTGSPPFKTWMRLLEHWKIHSDLRN